MLQQNYSMCFFPKRKLQYSLRMIGMVCGIVACFWGQIMLLQTFECHPSSRLESVLARSALSQIYDDTIQRSTVLLEPSTNNPAIIESLARVFPVWDVKEKPYPCVRGEKGWNTTEVLRSPSRTGIMFVRNLKTGSSTLAGVAIRMAQSLARKTNLGWDLCKVRFDHTPASLMGYWDRSKTQSFLWSFVRDPTERAISEFFHFAVSRDKREPSDDNFRHYIMHERKYMHNYFFIDMSLRNDTILAQNTTSIVEHIINDYDFIGVMERMDESLVALKMILNLDMNDILYLSAKQSGGFDDGGSERGCTYIVPHFVSPGMKQFFTTPEWKNRVEGDRMLLEAANRSLDLTIDALGRQEFERQLNEYRHTQRKVQGICGPSTAYPCTAGGKNNGNSHSCLWWDSGCGYACLDHLRTLENSLLM